jgi:hypothetical protein
VGGKSRTLTPFRLIIQYCNCNVALEMAGLARYQVLSARHHHSDNISSNFLVFHACLSYRTYFMTNRSSKKKGGFYQKENLKSTLHIKKIRIFKTSLSTCSNTVRKQGCGGGDILLKVFPHSILYD